MTDLKTHSDCSVFSRSSSSSTSESFCLSTSYSDCDSQAPHPVQPTFETKPDFTSKADTTLYRFPWSKSGLQHTKNPEDFSEIVNAQTNNIIMSTSGVSAPVFAKGIPPSKADNHSVDIRMIPPTLPRPTYWTTLTHPEVFKKYIKAESLIPRIPGATATTEDKPPPPEPFHKPYSNIHYITLANTDKEKIIPNISTTWINEHLFADSKLPAPFRSSVVSSDTELWQSKPLNQSGDPTFTSFPNLMKEKQTMHWLNHFGNSLGILHGLVTPNSNSSTKQNRTNVNPGSEDRAFDSEGSNKPLAKGLIARKPDIVLIDRTFRLHVPSEIRLRWPLVQALIEITAQEDRSYNDLMKTLLEKASNVFDSQLHRRFILGLVLLGKGVNMKFFFVLIDRVGAVSTKPLHIRGYGAMTLARIIYAFTFGSDRLLGADSRVTIDRLTGDPQSVDVDGQIFTIITEIHASPFVFGRGTRVYIVKDKHGHFHILKDSWILATHLDSEIDHLKKISDTVQTEVLAERFQVLSPRFVTGDNHVDNTDEPRGLLMSLAPARIRRRIVTGPIGDPITSYRSRVECLQALIDVVDQLEFLHDKCNLLHGDISISNIVIVRFLPNILAASPLHSASWSHVTVARPLLPTAGQQSADGPSSSSGKSPTTTMVAPSTGLSQPIASIDDDEGNLFVPWETLEPCTDEGLTYNLNSGGSVIDFDYACPKNTISSRASGTLPYMAIDLMDLPQPIERRLVHDLQSVCLVILHIIRFTCGPPGKPTCEIKLSHRVSQWHHERQITILKDHKKTDVGEIYDDALKYTTDYWAPIAPHITKLLNVVFPKITHNKVEKEVTCETFRNILIDARDLCATLPDKIPNYAAFPSPVASKKRSRTKSLAQTLPERKHLRPLTEGHVETHLPRDNYIVPFSQFKDSTSASSFGN